MDRRLDARALRGSVACCWRPSSGGRSATRSRCWTSRSSRIRGSPRRASRSRSTFFGMFGSLFLLTQYLQFVLGYTPARNRCPSPGVRDPGRRGRAAQPARRRTVRREGRGRGRARAVRCGVDPRRRPRHLVHVSGPRVAAGDHGDRRRSHDRAGDDVDHGFAAARPGRRRVGGQRHHPPDRWRGRCRRRRERLRLDLRIADRRRVGRARDPRRAARRLPSARSARPSASRVEPGRKSRCVAKSAFIDGLHAGFYVGAALLLIAAVAVVDLAPGPRPTRGRRTSERRMGESARADADGVTQARSGHVGERGVQEFRLLSLVHLGAPRCRARARLARDRNGARRHPRGAGAACRGRSSRRPCCAGSSWTHHTWVAPGYRSIAARMRCSGHGYSCSTRTTATAACCSSRRSMSSWPTLPLHSRTRSNGRRVERGRAVVEHRVEGVAREGRHRRTRGGHSQVSLRREADERDLRRCAGLSSERVEVLRRRRRVDDPQVVLGAQREESFEARARVLGALAVEAVGEEQRQARPLPPLVGRGRR